jgi:hypothetical protein
MILEYTQLLSTAWHVLEPLKAQEYLKNNLIYRPTHVNHPCSKWVRQHVNNYIFLVKLGLRLCKEWRFRYKHERVHACEPKLLFLQHNIPTINTQYINKTIDNPMCLLGQLPMAMPQQYKDNNVILAYRKYYKSPEKAHLGKWKHGVKPYWF